MSVTVSISWKVKFWSKNWSLVLNSYIIIMPNKSIDCIKFLSTNLTSFPFDWGESDNSAFEGEVDGMVTGTV